jgi:putative phosphoribosyl transferase
LTIPDLRSLDLQSALASMLFRDRFDAGHRLASLLREYAHRPDVLVLGLPRGGVPVAYAVAQELGVALDVFLVRKLGVPGQEELAMGAVASGGLRFINSEVVSELAISPDQIERVAESEQRELERRDRLYRGERPQPPISGKTVILIDDGLATGSSMRAAVRALRQHSPAQIIVAVPVAAASTCNLLRNEADTVVCLETPQPFYAVGQWYRDFSQTTDDEVRDLLQRPSQAGNDEPKLQTG